MFNKFKRKRQLELTGDREEDLRRLLGEDGHSWMASHHRLPLDKIISLLHFPILERQEKGIYIYFTQTNITLEFLLLFFFICFFLECILVKLMIAIFLCK